MRYSKGALPKNTSENTPEFPSGAKGISLPAVSVLQKAAPGEELQMKRIIQKAAPEEELQMKSVVQKAAAEEELQMKSVVQKAAPEEELQMKSIVQKASPEEELQMKNVVQKAAPEEELQMKSVVQKAAAEEELQMKSVVQKAAPEEEFQMKSIVQKASPEEELQMKAVIQKVAAPEEELQMKSMVQRKENKTGMPDQLKSGIENLSGMDMSDVKVHYNSSQPAQLHALAYAQGNDIHIGPGQEQHLAHEAWHVVQQRQGRVKPTVQMKESVAVNDDPGLEHEADVMGAKALQLVTGLANKTDKSLTGSDLKIAQFQPVMQMNPALVNFIRLTHYTAGALTTTLDYTTIPQARKDALKGYLDAANLQSATTMFHANEAGVLPANDLDDRECSRYLEFNLTMETFNRVIYNCETGAVYLTPHYNGYIQIVNPPADSIAHLEELALTNTGYLIDEEEDRGDTAWENVQTYRGILAAAENVDAGEGEVEGAAAE